jgi:amino acid adenylation domain-containing protein
LEEQKDMSDRNPQRAQLSPAKQALLEQRLRGAFAGLVQGNRIPKRPAQAPSPLSFSQQRLWFLDLLQGESSQYNNIIAQRLTGNLNMAVLEQCIQEIIRRHEPLRASFEVSEGQPVQRIAPVLLVPVPVLDLCNIPESARREEVLQSLAHEYTGIPFDLAMGPLLRFTVMRLAENEHVLLVVIHHIISDGWSLSVFWKEFVTLYDAFSSGQPSPLEELPIQYADYAAWQRSMLADENLERQLGYWREQLTGVPTILELPTDHRRPAKQSFRGARYPLVLGEMLTTRLREFAQQEGLTPFMVLLAAYATLLYRYTSQSDFLVGTPIAGRTQPETEPLIGFFVNTLVLRMDLSGDPSFRTLLKRVNAVAAGAYAHQEAPFEKIVEALQPERTLSHNPLFQVSFAYENVLTFTSSPANLIASPMTVDNGTSKFDLSLELMETDGNLWGSFEYSSDLFAEDTIARMGGHFQTLLEGIVAHPDHHLSQLPMLTEQERRRLTAPSAGANLHPLGIREEAAVGSACFHRLFEAQVKQTPAALAAIDGCRQFTYQELNTHANQLAHYLRELGVGPEAHVGLCMERSLDLIVGILGILKAGGCYVPLDPGYPRERLAFLVEDAHISLVLCQKRLRERLSGMAQRLVFVDDEWDKIAKHSQENLAGGATGNNLAYVIYTSGSTGKPKGVMVTHRGLSNYLLWSIHAYQIDQGRGAPVHSAITFDLTITSLFAPLLCGRTVILVPEEEAEAFPLHNVLREGGWSFVKLTPAHLELVANWLSPEDAAAMTARLIVGGEALTGEALAYWRAHAPQTLIVNEYGPTEAVVGCCVFEQAAGEILPGPVPIGRPVANMQLYVLDRDLCLAPIGVPGEIYIGGVGVARGYLDRPDLTAERFIPHPFASEPGARLYKTGDLARYRASGDIEYLGRNDHQLKIRGFRIEPGEIEAALASHPAVRETLVVAREDGARDKRLVAYLVPSAQQERPTSRSLRHHLQALLPEYMIPAAFVWLDEMPLTAHGKIDRAALPAPEQDRPEQEAPFVAPATQIETIVAEVWTEILGIDRVGALDNFFVLGGDSIRSVRVVSLLKQRGLSCSLPQLFQHQTVRELAQALVWEEPVVLASRPDQPFALIDAQDMQKLPAGLDDAYPATKLQLGMLFHSAYEHDSALYHNVISLHLQARFDQSSLEQALQVVADWHPVLRTSFDVSRYHEPLQLVHRTVTIPLHVDDLRHLPVEEQDQHIRGWLQQERNRQFNWAQPPLLRFHIHRRTGESFQLTLTNHHAILDGWSVAALLTEVLRVYVAVQEGQKTEAASAPAPATRFRDFVALERETMASESARRYWQEKLREPHIMKLPRWSARQQTAEPQRRQEIHTALSQDVAHGLRRLARQANVPLKSVLLAAHLKVMSVLGGETDVLTGLASSGRPEGVDSERVLGLFLNSVPFRQKLSGGSWIDLVQETFKHEQELLPFQRYPFAQLQLEHGGQHLFETLFNYTHFHVYQGLQGLPLKILDTYEFAEVDFALTTTIDLDVATSELRLVLQYNPAAFSEKQMQATASYYISALKLMAQAPTKRYEVQSLLSLAEEQQLLVEWNATATNYPRNQCVHQLFEQQVVLTPEAIAVAFEDQLLTYQTVNMRANQLAHHLQQLGVGPEVHVGLCLERSLDLVIALLAILKAGGVYVPLDPRYPQERLAFMLTDAQISVLLTQSALRGKLPPGDATVICLDKDWQQISLQPINNLDSRTVAKNLAYITYTSGSTGRPKGVCVAHQAVVRLVKATSYVQFTAKERFLQFAPISFDAATFEIWGSLLNGGVLVVPPPSELSLDELGKFLKHAQITTLWLTAGLFHLMVEEHLDSLEQIHQLLAGGDVLSVSHVRRVLHQFKGCRLVNGYGPTESTTFACCYSVDDSARFVETVPIGKPIANTQVYVLDGNLQLVPVGVVGELYIGGAGLARGYLQRPELTAERFIPHPFSKEPGARLYRTGDLVRYRPDGAIEFLGRKDRQVKIRGFRVEVGEIESILNRHPEVREAIVLAREMLSGEKRLVAYVVPHQQPEPAIQNLRSFLKERLPEYMMPATFVVLDALPLTPNGKVDYQVLPEPEWSGSEHEDAYVAPRTPLEEKLAAIWAELFKLALVGVNDNFFELGGHSLLAMQVATRVRNTLGFNLPLRMLFEAPTIARLAEALERYKATPGQSGAPARLRQPIGRASINQGDASFSGQDG